MSFTSNLRGDLVIDDNIAAGFAQQNRGRGRGYMARDWDANPFASYANAFSAPVIPRDEWDERIEELERTKSLLTDLEAYRKVPVLDQKKTNYCWCYGAVAGIMARSAAQGTAIPDLSAASAAAKIKNYQNVGGWGGEAIAGIKKFGVSTLEHWPNAAIDPQYDTHEQQLNAKQHMAVEFEELNPKSFDEVMSCLLLGFPVPAGLLWWGHLVCFMDPLIIKPGQYGVRFKNSWGAKWEKNGHGILTEKKATPDEANCIRTVSLTA